MTALWAWADLGDHALQRYNIKQYWLVMSVLSVKKFNPEWKRVFIVDQVTADYIRSRNWDHLWDEIKIVDFKDTEYGNLYDIKIYSWPKLYSYGLVDDDLLVLDIDIVFLKKFIIPVMNNICGKFYNHIDDFLSKTKIYSLDYKWPNIEKVNKELYDNSIVDFKLKQKEMCLLGSPVYVPKQYGKQLSDNLINHIKKVESYFNGLCPDDTFQALEEEYPLMKFAKMCGTPKNIDDKSYRHGFTYLAYRTIDKGFDEPERILEEKVFDKYINI